MRILYFNSFLKNLKSLPYQKRLKIENSIKTFVSCLENKAQIPLGFGLKKLAKGNLWEIRTGLGLRIVFTIKSAILSFVFVGKHNEVKRYLKAQ